MSEALKYCLIIILTGFGFVATGQESETPRKDLNRYFHIGPLVSVPVMDYADTDFDNNYSGFARMGFGFSFGYKEFIEESPGYLHIGFSAVYQLMSYHTEVAEELVNSGVYETPRVGNPEYFFFPLRIGLGLGSRKEKHNIHFEAFAGATLTKIFAGSMSIQELPPLGDLRFTTETESEWGSTFAVGAELGYSITEKLLLSVEYLHAHNTNLNVIQNLGNRHRDWKTHQQMLNIKVQRIFGKK